MTQYVLDTDHLTLLQRFHSFVMAKVNATPPSEIAITIITAEEQLRGRFSQIRRFPTGFECVNAYRRLRETLDRLKAMTILDFDIRSELIDQSLRRQHPRMGTQDRRIAAITLANNCTLITRNRIHFGQIPNLILEDWSK
ncbi:MAG: type II toxin-antitoxin system VapC family toxin [Blastocatellia bacterium]